MIKELIKLANHLDSKGLTEEADALDAVVKRAMIGSHSDGKYIYDDSPYYSLDYAFVYSDVNGEQRATDVRAATGTEPANRMYESSAKGGPQISLTWGCDSWRIDNDLGKTNPLVEVGSELDNHTVTAIWKLDKDGYIIDETPTAVAKACGE